jgi:hypothetical protein
MSSSDIKELEAKLKLFSDFTSQLQLICKRLDEREKQLDERERQLKEREKVLLSQAKQTVKSFVNQQIDNKPPITPRGGIPLPTMPTPRQPKITTIIQQNPTKPVSVPIQPVAELQPIVAPYNSHIEFVGSGDVVSSDRMTVIGTQDKKWNTVLTNMVLTENDLYYFEVVVHDGYMFVGLAKPNDDLSQYLGFSQFSCSLATRDGGKRFCGKSIDYANHAILSGSTIGIVIDLRDAKDSDKINPKPIAAGKGGRMYCIINGKSICSNTNIGR